MISSGNSVWIIKFILSDGRLIYRLAPLLDGIINEFYNKIVNISIKVGYDKNTIKFLGYHVEDIADLFYRMDMQDALNFLLKYDIENEAIYEKYIKWKNITLLFLY